MKNIAIKTVIIDDDVASILALIDLLNTSTLIDIVGTATNFEDGISLIKVTQPDIVFIDINLPGRIGLEIYNEFVSPDFKIILCTSNLQFTPFELSKFASGYLLKPANKYKLHHIFQKVYDEIIHEHKLQK